MGSFRSALLPRTVVAIPAAVIRGPQRFTRMVSMLARVRDITSLSAWVGAWLLADPFPWRRKLWFPRIRVRVSAWRLWFAVQFLQRRQRELPGVQRLRVR